MGNSLLSIENLTVSYGKETALSIERPITIEEGDRIGIIGSNGAGKTTLIKSILGLVKYQGNIYTSLTPEMIATHMQSNEYTDAMAVRHIMEAVLGTKISKNKKLKELISYFEFEGCLKKKYKHLSGGQKQRFTIIMVMMQDLPLTFYDEVTSGLDFETRQKLVEKLAAWYKDKDVSLCMVSPYPKLKAYPQAAPIHHNNGKRCTARRFYPDTSLPAFLPAFGVFQSPDRK